MTLQFTNLNIHIPGWFLAIILVGLLVQTTMGVVLAYYKLKLARLKAED